MESLPACDRNSSTCTSCSNDVTGRRTNLCRLSKTIMTREYLSRNWMMFIGVKVAVNSLTYLPLLELRVRILILYVLPEKNKNRQRELSRRLFRYSRQLFLQNLWCQWIRITVNSGYSSIAIWGYRCRLFTKKKRSSVLIQRHVHWAYLCC